jgi:protein O-mannosyl-transferase
LKPGLHHLTSLLFHMANTLLLFWVLFRMTGASYRSAFVAALFALHPLHVEPMAWVAARKDLLSAFFWMLTMAVYLYYVKRPKWFKYLLVLLAFALGLMAKAMIVTLPLILLLLDYWPLNRFQVEADVGAGDSSPKKSLNSRHRTRRVLGLVLEKALFFVTLGGSVFMTVSFMMYERLPMFSLAKIWPKKEYVAEALVFYTTYLIKMIWPFGLATPYPYTPVPPVWQIAGAGAFLVIVSTMSIRWLRSRPYLFVGWFWYLITLLPVIGLVKFGPHSIADRYTYISLIGIFIIIAWGVPDILPQWPHRRRIMGGLAVVLLVAYSVVSWVQTGYWKNSITLLGHAVQVTEGNWMAHSNLGVALKDAGRPEDAIPHYEASLRINPKDYKARINLGFARMQQGDLDAATRHFSESLRIHHRDPLAHFTLGILLKKQGKCSEALIHFSESLRIKPGNAEAHENLGICLAKTGDLPEAVRQFSQALAINPRSVGAHMNLGITLMRQDRPGDAIHHFEEALQIRPDDPKTLYILGTALNEAGRPEEAVEHLKESLRIRPGNAIVYNQLGIALAKQGDLSGAADKFSEALQVQPDNPQALMNMGMALKKMGRDDEAIPYFSKVLQIRPDHVKARRMLEMTQEQLQGP